MRRFPAAVVVLLFAGCGPREDPLSLLFPFSPEPVAATVSETDADIFEVVFRDLLREASADEVCFISLGYDRGTWVDAPDHLLRRLEDLDFEIKKPSEARFAEPEREGDGSEFAPIRDRASGRKGSVYWGRITKRLGRNEVEVVAGRVVGFLDGGGHWGVVRKVGERWVIERVPGSFTHSGRS